MMSGLRLGAPFLSDDDGAITVDWVVLTAAVVGLGAIVLAALRGNMGELSSDVGEFQSSQTIATTF
jgi:hypothetical protein